MLLSGREALTVIAVAAAAALLWSLVRLLVANRTARRWLSVAIVGAAVATLAVALLGRSYHQILELFHSLSIRRPVALVLLLAVPPAVWLSFRSLAPLGQGRRIAAILLRSAVLVILVLALAQLAYVQRSDELSVIFAIDLSDSVPVDLRLRARQWIEQVLLDKPPEDRVGFVYFASEPYLHMPPVTYAEVSDPEARVDTTATDIAAAIRLARASFPEDTARRIVLVTDGNETKGDAIREAMAAAADGIPIDVFPILYQYENDVAVDRVLTPSTATAGETIRIRVLLKSLSETAGTLRVFARSGKGDVLIEERHVQLRRSRPDQREIVHAEDVLFRVEEPRFYRFIAQFSPDDPKQDRSPQNNALASYVYVRGKARVLLAGSDEDNTNFLRTVLEREKFAVEVVGPGAVPSDAAVLAGYDLIVLNNVPAALGTSDEELPEAALNERQMRAIERTVHDAGTGLVVIGGPDSYGAGGYDDTPLEKALPVNMEIPGLKLLPRGALVCIFHASEMARGNYWQKVVAKQTIRALSPRDEIGVIAWRGITAWVHPLQPAGNKRRVLARIDRMVPGDMPDADPGLRMAGGALAASSATYKLIIVISDFDPAPPRPQTVQWLVRHRIKVTCVAVATHGGAGATWATDLAKRTGGRFYHVVDPRALPRIFFREAMRVARNLIFERSTPWKPSVVALTEPIADVNPADLHPISGYVSTTPKTSELVAVPIVSTLPLPSNPAPILAHWRYGLGKSVAFTSDLGTRWCRAWTRWAGYRQFWARILRWALREMRSQEVQISTRVVGDRLIVTADVTDTNGDLLDHADVVARVVTPELKSYEVRLTQVGPGRYEGEIAGIEEMGSYLVTAAATHPQIGTVQAATGVSVPYSAEYALLESNRVVLNAIATVSGGQLIDPTRPTTDVFRRDFEPRTTHRPLWETLLLVAAVLFFADVLNRKIAFSTAPLQEWHRRRREAARELERRLEQLKERKKTVRRKWLEIHSKAAPSTEEPVVSRIATSREGPRQTAAEPTTAVEVEAEPDELTRRLLEAKRRALSSRRHTGSSERSPTEEQKP